MSARKAAVLRAPTTADTLETLLRQYGGRIQLSGSDDALYERHLLFDDVVDPAAANPCPVP